MGRGENDRFFLKRAHPLPGESLTSLVHRLTELNRYADETWIIKLIEPTRSRVQRFDLDVHTSPDQLRRLAGKNRTPYNHMYEMTAHRFAEFLLREQEIERDAQGFAFIGLLPKTTL